MNKKQQKYRNSKIQGLFMCKKQIEKLKKKVLGLIQQPCEGFQWNKKQVKGIKSKIQQKTKTKSKSTDKKIIEVQNVSTKVQIDNKQVQPKRKFCPCKQFSSQSRNKKNRQVSYRKSSKPKVIFQEDLKTNKKLRFKTSEPKKLFSSKVTPKKEKNQKYKNKKVGKNDKKYESEKQSPKTIQSRNIKPFSINTESTIDHIEVKKENSPQSVILFSRTQRVSFQGDDQLAESFLLSERSHPNPSELGLLLKSSKRQNRRSKDSLIKIQHAQEKEKKYDKSIMNRILLNNNSQKIDFTTCWKSINSQRSQHKPLSLELIKKIGEKTQKFMKTQIHPFQKSLHDEQQIENLRDSLGLSRSLVKNQQIHYESFRLWIDEQNEQ